MSKTINIRPTTSVYATYKNIKYDPWTAIAEFVDNSTQSYYDNVSKLEQTKYWKGLEIEITYERDAEIGERLIIKDNAFGMDFNDFQRAIMLDSPPKKPTRSEFGMGLKTAACWFGRMWSVETTALDSHVKYKATVDVDMLQKYKNEEIEVEEIPCNPKDHGTVITIWKLNRKMSGRQIGKAKDQLRGMYRTDLRTGKIHIYYNEEKLSFETPKILEESLPDGNIKKWKKDVAFTVACDGKEYHVNGFIALLDEGSTSGAGFTLIRRGRVIIGGYENCYRPEEIFEKSNSFVYQRLFGELNMDDWPVTQTKDAFDWYSGLEDLFIEKLLECCHDYKKKAKAYRKNKIITVEPVFGTLVNNFQEAGIIDNVTVSEIDVNTLHQPEQEPLENNNTQSVEESLTPPQDGEIQIVGTNGQKVSFTSGGRNYVFNFILRSDNPDANWLTIHHETVSDEYTIEWNIRHPFFKPYIDDPKFLEIMQQFTFALALSEIESRYIGDSGNIPAGAIRTKMNETLKAVISERE